MNTLQFLYETIPGRAVLKILVSRPLSKAVGFFLDTPLSKPLIGPFVRSNHIDLSQFESDHFQCFNDCFCRKIKPGLRSFDPSPDVLTSPCDGLLSVYPINDDTVLPIKQSSYTISSLLRSKKLASRYKNGTCLVFRLCVDHYHRYSYLDSGTKGPNRFIPGCLHTVRPIALENLPVFVRNCREYTIMETEHFGTVTQIEVGAMFVGKIKNHHQSHTFLRGEEKGMFLYGGSTIVVLLEKGKAAIHPSLLEASAEGREVPVVMGQSIGSRL